MLVRPFYFSSYFWLLAHFYSWHSLPTCFLTLITYPVQYSYNTMGSFDIRLDQQIPNTSARYWTWPRTSQLQHHITILASHSCLALTSYKLLISLLFGPDQIPSPITLLQGTDQLYVANTFLPNTSSLIVDTTTPIAHQHPNCRHIQSYRWHDWNKCTSTANCWHNWNGHTSTSHRHHNQENTPQLPIINMSSLTTLQLPGHLTHTHSSL